LDAILIIVVGLLAAAGGLGAGLKLRHQWGVKYLNSAQETAEHILNEAKTRQRDLILEAKDEALKIRAAAEAESRERRAEFQRQERRLQQKEENLDQKLEQLDRRDQQLRQREQELTQRHTEIDELRRQQVVELERVANLTRDEARDVILRRVEEEAKEIAAKRAREIELAAKEEADAKARKLLAITIQRYSAEQVAETTISVVPIPNEEMKGRIIGREGRNIRALEAATGVDLIIDDTPDAVSLSGFDPIRREIARVALSKLVTDGRIHPGRIEEIVAKAKQEVEQTIRQEGEQAAIDAGVHGLHPEIIKAMGRMKFRTSYGQNQLQHSVEAAHLAAMLAHEIGADVEVCRRGAFLHDIGKILTHELEGPHHIMGAEFIRRFGENPRVLECVQGHHDADPEFQSVEAVIVQSADAISGARPGARRENVEHYIQRLTALENVANSFPGVEKSYAIQAGREVRILVRPEEIDDSGAQRLARDIVKKIEETLQYPGQVKVTVVRETRAVEYAR
jgi:ribonuclease Y